MPSTASLLMRKIFLTWTVSCAIDQDLLPANNISFIIICHYRISMIASPLIHRFVQACSLVFCLNSSTTSWTWHFRDLSLSTFRDLPLPVADRSLDTLMTSAEICGLKIPTTILVASLGSCIAKLIDSDICTDNAEVQHPKGPHLWFASFRTCNIARRFRQYYPAAPYRRYCRSRRLCSLPARSSRIAHWKRSTLPCWRRSTDQKLKLPKRSAPKLVKGLRWPSESRLEWGLSIMSVIFMDCKRHLATGSEKDI